MFCLTSAVTKMYMVLLLYIQALEMDVLHLPSKALASCHVCAVELQPSVQINGGSRQADRQPFTSPVCNCATRERKKTHESDKKRGRKEEGTRVETNPSGAVFHLPFNILQRKVPSVCVCVASFGLVQDSCFCFCSSVSLKLDLKT